MKQDKGSVLAIVLILMVALYLLASMMSTVNRQYLSDMDMAQEAALNRQKLLSAGQTFIRQLSESNEKEKSTLFWEDCGIFSEPEYQYIESEKLFYQIAQLPLHCYDHLSAYRIWLKNEENLDDRLVLDWLKRESHWQDSLDDDNGEKIEVMLSEKGWQISVNNGQLQQIISLADPEEFQKLAEQKIRVLDDFYELVLVFENMESKSVTLYHLEIPKVSLYFDAAMIFVYQAEIQNFTSMNHMIAKNYNDARNTNWRVTVDHSIFKHLHIQNSALFIALQEYKILGMHLSGQPFFDEQILGYQASQANQEIILIECIYHSPLVIDQLWRVGCESNHKIQYYFPE